MERDQANAAALKSGQTPSALVQEFRAQSAAEGAVMIGGDVFMAAEFLLLFNPAPGRVVLLVGGLLIAQQSRLGCSIGSKFACDNPDLEL